MLTRVYFLLQAHSQPAGDSPTTLDAKLLADLMHQLLLVILLFVLAIVVIVIVLRSHHMNLLKSRRSRCAKSPDLEDIWFENPIERKGIKPAPPSPREDEPPRDDPPSDTG